MRQKKMLEKIHSQIRASCPNEKAHDFIIYTDGSGYTDGYGGASSLMVSKKYGLRETRLISYSHVTTDRAEFEALLSGLQSIVESMGWSKVSKVKELMELPVKPSVCWYTDRESLALAIWRDENGETIYKRKTSGDLWARFEFYEQIFDISPFCIERNSTEEHAYVDKLASESRLIVKEYFEILKIDN